MTRKACSLIATPIACMVALLLVASCGDEDLTPKEMCQESYDTLCGKLSECQVSSSLVSSCWTAADQVCGEINAVVDGKSPDACNTDIQNMNCSTVRSNFSLPSTCKGLYTDDDSSGGGSSGGGSSCNCSSVVRNCSYTYDSAGRRTEHCTCSPSCCC